MTKFPKELLYRKMTNDTEFLPLMDKFSDKAWEDYEDGSIYTCVRDLVVNRNGLADSPLPARYGFPNLREYENAVEFMEYIMEFSY